MKSVELDKSSMQLKKTNTQTSNNLQEASNGLRSPSPKVSNEADKWAHILDQPFSESGTVEMLDEPLSNYSVLFSNWGEKQVDDKKVRNASTPPPVDRNSQYHRTLAPHTDNNQRNHSSSITRVSKIINFRSLIYTYTVDSMKRTVRK
jgi:predicted chitinase